MQEKDKEAMQTVGGMLTDALNTIPGKFIARAAARDVNEALDHIGKRLEEIPKLEAALANAQHAALEHARVKALPSEG